MNLFALAWKNIISKPLNTLLSLVLFALGVGLISLLFLLDDQLQKNFEKNLAEIDLVIGAKGSPLQMILSSMYHIDAPTGNISLGSIGPFMNPKHPLIKSALPISMGDSYRGYRIVGTVEEMQEWYKLNLSEGEWYASDFEVTIGASVARNLNLSLGDRFRSSHGLSDDEDLEHEDAQEFVVKGILIASGTVVDQLILTTPQTYWQIHDHENDTEDPEGEGHAHEVHDNHEGHDHRTLASLRKEDPEKEITNLLLRFKGRNFQALNMQRSINENTDMQAATPAIEINRLFSMMNDAEQALRILAIVIILVSGMSIFISLYSSLKERRYELSLMRVMGSTREGLFTLLILEGLLLAFIGFILGTILSHVGIEIIGSIMNEDYRYDFSGMYFLQNEGLLLIGSLILGLLASLLPAMQASRTDISETLSKG